MTLHSDKVKKPLNFFRLLFIAPWSLAFAIVTGIGSAALSIAPCWLIYLMAVEIFKSQPDMSYVWHLVWWTLGLLFVRWSLMVISHITAHMGAFLIQHRLKMAMARQLGKVPLSFFTGRGTGSLRKTLTDDVNGLEGFFAHMLPDAVAAATVPVIAMVLLFFADWRMALAALSPLPFAFIAQWLWMRNMRQQLAQWNLLQKKIANVVGEYVRGIHVVKTFGLATHSFGELANAIRGAAQWVASYAQQSAGGWTVFTGLLTANIIVVAPVGAWLYLHGSLDMPTYILFLLVAPVVLSPLLRLTFAMGEQMQRAEALHRIDEILLAKTLSDHRDTPIPEQPFDITFEHVRHRYGERLAIDDISFTAKAGKLTALVGASGSGKSTLIQLVARLYEFEAGKVSVGGVDVRDWPLDSLLAQLGIVFQDVFLFHGTVRDNLRVANQKASNADIEAAAKAACAHDFIMDLPLGYDTPLGDRGARLSGGERQRLSIARALLKNAPILLLDEATASIDAENETLIQQALNTLSQGRTVLMIAHRLRCVMHADQIIVMDKGHIVGQGNHQSLLADCAVYQRLWHDSENARDWVLDNMDNKKENHD